MSHVERPDEDTPERVVTLRRRQWESPDKPQTVVALRKRKSYSAGYDAGDDVYVDGRWVGTVCRYTGSLDRKIGRLRSPGKRRTLWSAEQPGDSRAMYEFVSRAEAIRWLLR